MSKILVDQVQRIGGVPFTLPATAGTANQFLTTGGDGILGFGTLTTVDQTNYHDGLVAPIGKGIIGSILSQSQRQNIYSTGEWTSSGPWTTYSNFDAYTDNSLIQFINMALSDGHGGNTSSTAEYTMNDGEKAYSRQLMFSNGSRLGWARDQMYYDNVTGHAGHTWQIMPVRNTGTTSISVGFSGIASDYWENGYEGCSLFIIYPNTSSTLYSTVTTVATSRLAYAQNSSRSNQITGSYVISPGQTVLACLASTHHYQTTYRFKDLNYFYDLQTTFTNANIVCDMRMLSSLAKSKFSLPYSGSAVGNSALAPIWTMTAANFGDR